MQIEWFSKIATKQRIDKNAGVIYGVSVISEGEAKGHDLQIDSKMLSQVAEVGAGFSDGVKVRMNHPQRGKDAPIQSIIGSLKNFSVDGGQVRADLHLLKSDENYDKILEMAEKMPENFGLSLVYGGGSEENGQTKLARCTDIFACDLVDSPAANPTGLFSYYPEQHDEFCGHCGKPKMLCSHSLSAEHGGFLVDKDGEQHLPTHKHGSPDHRLMGAAWAALHGGYRGHKYEGPNKSEAIKKLKELYKKEGLTPPDESKKQHSTLMNIETTLLAASLGLPETATEDEILTALAAKKDDKKKNDDEDDKAMSAKLDELVNRLSSIESSSKNTLALSQKHEIETMLSEASAAGKVVPFENDDLYTEKDGIVTIKMVPTQLAKVINKLPSGQIKVGGTKTVTTSLSSEDKKPLDRRSPEFRAMLAAKRQESAERYLATKTN